MGIREKLNNSPKVAAGIGVGALAVGVVFLVSQLSSGGLPERAFFTVDDGETWFADDAQRIPPFLKDGKEAVRAYVFECDGKEFVNHLERYTPERRKLMEAAAEAARTGKPPPAPPAAAGQTAMWGQEFKKPGQKQWVPASNLAKSTSIIQAKCPDGSEALPVIP